MLNFNISAHLLKRIIIIEIMKLLLLLLLLFAVELRKSEKKCDESEKKLKEMILELGDLC